MFLRDHPIPIVFHWVLAAFVITVGLSHAAASRDGCCSTPVLVQASGFRLHEHFNHNDLYHVIHTVAVILLYRGARRLTDS